MIFCFTLKAYTSAEMWHDPWLELQSLCSVIADYIYMEMCISWLSDYISSVQVVIYWINIRNSPYTDPIAMKVDSHLKGKKSYDL